MNIKVEILLPLIKASKIFLVSLSLLVGVGRGKIAANAGFGHLDGWIEHFLKVSIKFLLFFQKSQLTY